MEQIIQQRLKEFNQLQSDYDELYEKFQLSHRLYDEKERIYQKQMKELTDIIIKLKAKNTKLKQVVAADKEMKESFQQDVLKLQELFNLMEQKEKDFLLQIRTLTEENQTLSSQQKSLQSQLSRSQQENSRLTYQLEEEYISKREYQMLKQRTESLENMVKVDYVSKSEVHQLQSDYQQLQHSITTNYISKELYVTLEASYQTMMNNIKSQYIDLISYQRLQENYETLFHEKKVLEDTMTLVQEDQQQSQQEKQELQAKIVSLKDRISKSEELLTSYEQELSSGSEERQKLSQENALIYQEKQDLLAQLEALEKQKLQFVLQLQSIKQQLKKEVEAKQECQQQLAALEKRSHQSEMEYSNKLIESNAKLTSIYESKEYHWKEKLSELANYQQVLQEKLQTLQAMYDQVSNRSQEQVSVVHQLEQEKSELKASLAVQQAYHETAAREIRDYQQQIMELKQEKYQLQQRVIELTHTMDEFRATIVSELSPSIGKYLSDPFTNTSQSMTFAPTSPPIPPPPPATTGTSVALSPMSPRGEGLTGGALQVDTNYDSQQTKAGQRYSGSGNVETSGHQNTPQYHRSYSSSPSPPSLSNRKTASTPVLHSQISTASGTNSTRTSNTRTTTVTTFSTRKQFQSSTLERQTRSTQSLSALHETKNLVMDSSVTAAPLLSPKHRKTSETNLLDMIPSPTTSPAAAAGASSSNPIPMTSGAKVKEQRSDSLASSDTALSHDNYSLPSRHSLSAAMSSAPRPSSRPASPISGSTSFSSNYRKDLSRSGGVGVGISSLPADALDHPSSVSSLPVTAKPLSTSAASPHQSGYHHQREEDLVTSSLSPLPRVNTPSKSLFSFNGTASDHIQAISSPNTPTFPYEERGEGAETSDKDRGEARDSTADDSLGMNDHSIVKEYSQVR